MLPISSNHRRPLLDASSNAHIVARNAGTKLES